MSRLLITGTDTNVGKTWVTCALARALRASGRRVGVMKPVETGVTGEPEDARRLQAAAADDPPLAEICPYQLRMPVAPAVAAAHEGVTVDLDLLVASIARRQALVDVFLVEGAGGLLVPIAGKATFLDLAQRAALPLLIVAANRLGTVNHTALTARVAEAAGLTVIGFVLSQPTPTTDVSAASNARAITELTGLTCCGELAYGATGPLDLGW
jgi:dethiobiotin synthetase